MPLIIPDNALGQRMRNAFLPDRYAPADDTIISNLYLHRMRKASPDIGRLVQVARRRHASYPELVHERADKGRGGQIPGLATRLSATALQREKERRTHWMPTV